MINQMNIGAFLKELRRERGITQEQLAERLNVSARTVSRWETGSNLPDLSVLVEIADFYDIDIREIINGERKSENMDKELKDTLKQVAQYSEEEKKSLKKRMLGMTSTTLIIFLFSVLLEFTEGFGFIPPEPCENFRGFALGLTTAGLLLNCMYLSGALDAIKKIKQRLFSGKEEGRD